MVRKVNRGRERRIGSRIRREFGLNNILYSNYWNISLILIVPNIGASSTMGSGFGLIDIYDTLESTLEPMVVIFSVPVIDLNIIDIAELMRAEFAEKPLMVLL